MSDLISSNNPSSFLKKFFGAGIESFESWGRYPKVQNQNEFIPYWLNEAIPYSSPLLAYGLGRSYGDCCLCDNGTIISTRNINRLISFDKEDGIIECDAGISFSDLLEFIVPHGWFLPVTPGTRFVTLGGAIANDVHGKNHHREGTFGRHIIELELLRSDCKSLILSAGNNPEFFNATIGGIGLTGLITKAKIKLKKIHSAFIDAETIRFGNLNGFDKLARDPNTTHEYTVAWLDGSSRGKSFGRGHFIRGNHSEEGALVPGKKNPSITIPCDFPEFFLNRLSIRAFNETYFRKPLANSKIHYSPFFYPLDVLGKWNRIYGKRGFFQYQCVIPETAGIPAIHDLLETGIKLGTGSFLTVLKHFGELKSPGMLSFPMKGYTITMDFPFEKLKSIELIKRLDAITRSAGGRVYTAKDAGSADDLYYSSFNIEKFEKFIDPAFSSNLWRRVKRSRV